VFETNNLLLPVNFITQGDVLYKQTKKLATVSLGKEHAVGTLYQDI